MEFEQIIKLVETVSASSLESFKLEQNGTSLKMKMAYRDGAAAPAIEKVAYQGKAATPVSTEEIRKDGAAEQFLAVESPLVGIFYAAPAEDAEPFVQVGDRVKKGQVLAIVEAMKLMNEIESSFDGVVKEICVENGRPVEFGQPLFLIGEE